MPCATSVTAIAVLQIVQYALKNVGKIS